MLPATVRQGSRPGLLEGDAVVLVEPGLPGGLAEDLPASPGVGGRGRRPAAAACSCRSRSGPISETNSPGATSRSTPSSAVTWALCGREDTVEAATCATARLLCRDQSTASRRHLRSAVRPQAQRRSALTNPAATSPTRTAPKIGAHGLAGSPPAAWAYSMTSRPMPPRSPIETSATTVPITADAAASRSAGSRYGTLAGSRKLSSVPPPADAVGAHQVEVGRVGRLQPAQRADGDREERQVCGDDRHRVLAVPREAADAGAAIPSAEPAARSRSAARSG